VPNNDGDMTTAQLLRIADDLLRAVVPGTRGLWPRVVAFLVRLALEKSIDEFWDRTQPGMTRCSTRAQLVCLREFAEPSLAGRTHQVWASLSAACHYHQYDLPPTAAELRTWQAEVTAIGDALESMTRRSGLAR
jgi:hypothetical protein